jgi:hypothetical protein
MNAFEIIRPITLDTVMSVMLGHGLEIERDSGKGFDALSIRVKNAETRIFYAAIDQNCLKLVAELEIGEVGNINVVHEWNMNELGCTLVSLTTGYAMKNDTLLTGGMTVGMIPETVFQFYSALVRLSKIVREGAI